MKKLVLTIAAVAAFALAPSYGVDNIQELLELTNKIQAETERAKTAKTPEEKEAVIKELERLTRKAMELAGMTQKDTEAAVASIREHFKDSKNPKTKKTFDKAEKKLDSSAKQLGEAQKLMDAADGKDKEKK